MPGNDPVRALALAAIDADAQARDLRAPADDIPRRISFTALKAYAADPALAADPAFHARLREDARARADLAHLMRRSAWSHMPRLAAAATGETARRETDRAVITVVPSRADAAQVYLIVILNDAAAAPPSRLTTMDADGVFADLDLGPFGAGRVQLLLDAEADVVRALRDDRAEVYLR